MKEGVECFSLPPPYTQSIPPSSENEQPGTENPGAETENPVDKPPADKLPSVSTTPPNSPSWRRTSSYENLQEIPIGGSSKERATSFMGPATPKRIALRGSSSTEHLASRVSSPMGRGTTLSMSGSEAESLYGNV